ncbi:MAG: MFS transporter [Bacillota bacterium]
MKRNTVQALVFVVFCLLFIFALFFRTSIAIIVEDLMHEFTIPAAYLGLMSSTFFYAYAAMQMPVGVLCDRIGVRRTVLYFGLLGGVGSLLFASATGVQTATWGRLLTGIGTAGVWIPALKYLSLNYRPHIFATLSSIISAVGSFGIILGTLPLALLVEAKGWRFPFISASLIMVLLVGVAWFLMKSPAESQQNNKENRREGENENTILKEEQISADKTMVSPFWKNPVFWYFALWAFLFYGVLFSFTGLWGASFLQDTFQISRETASTHLLFSSIGVLVGSLSWAIVSDRLLRARRPLLIAGTCGFLFLWLIIFSLNSYPGGFLTSLLYFSLGTCGMTFILMFSCTKEYFPLQTAGAAMGTVNAFMLGGVAVFQGITGYLLDFFQTVSASAGYRAIFVFYLAALAVAFVFSLLMPETFPGKTKKSAISGNTAVSVTPDADGSGE